MQTVNAPLASLNNHGLRPAQSSNRSKKSWKNPTTPADQLNLSTQKHLGNLRGLSAQPEKSLNRSARMETKAFQNPFSAVRSPISEAEFNRILENLAPVANASPSENSKIALKKLLTKGNRLLSEVARLQQAGKHVSLIVYREKPGEEEANSSAALFDKHGKPVEMLGTTFLPSNTKTTPADVGSCVLASLLFSLLLGPQVAISGPLTSKAEKLGESLKRQKKDVDLYLKSFMNPAHVNFEFEAVQLSPGQKRDMAPVAKRYGKNVYLNNELRSYMEMILATYRQAGKALQQSKTEHPNSTVKIGLLANGPAKNPSEAELSEAELKDVTHLFQPKQ